MQLNIKHIASLEVTLFPWVHSVMYELDVADNAVMSMTMDFHEGKCVPTGEYSYRDKSIPPQIVRGELQFCKMDSELEGALVAVAVEEMAAHKYPNVSIFNKIKVQLRQESLRAYVSYGFVDDPIEVPVYPKGVPKDVV